MTGRKPGGADMDRRNFLHLGAASVIAPEVLSAAEPAEAGTGKRTSALAQLARRI